MRTNEQLLRTQLRNLSKEALMLADRATVEQLRVILPVRHLWYRRVATDGMALLEHPDAQAPR